MRRPEHPRCGRWFIGRGVLTPEEGQDVGQHRVVRSKCLLALVPLLRLLTGVVIGQKMEEVEVGHGSIVGLDEARQKWHD